MIFTGRFRSAYTGKKSGTQFLPVDLNLNIPVNITNLSFYQ